LPDLSRFEIQCLRRLWSLGEASVREIHAALPDAPGYSSVRKIVERLEEKGAVERVRLEGKAWIYRSAVAPREMIGKEIGRLLDTLFDGATAPLISHLAESKRLSLDDLRAIEDALHEGPAPDQGKAPGGASRSVRGATPRGEAARRRGPARRRDGEAS
jgi:predicted transcriptional regulator